MRLEYSDSVVSGPEFEPVDLSQVKLHLRVSGTSEDTLIDGYMAAARQRLEQDCGRHLPVVLRERRYHHGFPTKIELPKPPLYELVSIQYVGDDGELVTLAESEYDVDPPDTDRRVEAEPAVIVPASGVTWPTPANVRNAVRVRFYAGYGRTPAEIPDVLKAYFLALVEGFYSFRGLAQSGEQTYPTPIGYEDFVRNLKWSARCKYQAVDVEVTA